MKKTIRLALPAVALLVIAAALTRRHAPAAEPTDARVQQMLQERFGACDAPEAAPAVLAVDRDVRIEARTWTADVTPRGARVACADGFVHVSRGPALEMNRPADRTVEFMHADGVRERLEVRDDGLEQSFVFDSPVMGDIAVECAIDSDLDAACDETPGAGLVFSKDGVARLVYRKAMAIDAAGRTLDLSIAWNAGRVRMTIPAWWVETAAFPVVLDPVIGPATTVATGVSSYGSPTLGRYGSAYDASSNTYMTACQTGTNVRLQRVTAAGVLVGSATLFPGTHPQVAYSPSSSQYLVTYTSASIIRGRRYTNLGAPVGGEFTIGDAAGISDRFAHVVWGAARWLVVWQGGAIRGQFVNTDGTLSGAALDISGATPVFGAGGTGDTEPPRVGYASGTYLVVTRGTSSNYIAWRVSDSTSALVGGTISVGSGSFTRAPDVVGRSSATGARFVVTWVNNILIIPSIETRVRGRFVFTDGTLGTEIEYASNLADPSNSVIASLCSVGYSPSADEFLVAWGWDPNLSVSGDQSLRVQRVNVTTGAAIGGAEDVFSAVTSATDPVLAAGVNEQFLVLALNGSTQLGRIWGTSLPPTLTISSPAGGSTVGSTPLSVTGTAADTDGTIAGVAWTNSTSGVSGSASGAGTWSASVPLVAGANTIVFTATDSEGVTGTSTLAVTYTPAVPSIGLAPASLSFSGTAGGPNPAPQTVTLTNTGSGTLAWTATESLAWAGVAPSTGSLAAGASMTMTVSTSITGLGSGTYTGAISITAPGASNSPQSIPLTLTLTSSPTIGLSPSSLSFAGPTGGPNPAPQTLTITNTGGGTLAWTLSESLAWLSAAPTSGSLTAGASGTPASLSCVRCRSSSTR